MCAEGACPAWDGYARKLPAQSVQDDADTLRKISIHCELHGPTFNAET